MAISHAVVDLISAADSEIVAGPCDEAYIRVSAKCVIGAAGVGSTGFPLLPTDPPLRVVLGAAEAINGRVLAYAGGDGTARAYVLKNTA